MITEDLLAEGIQAQHTGELLSAVNAFRQVLRLDPAHPTATRSLLTIAKQLRNPAQAPVVAAAAPVIDQQIEVERRKYERVWEHDDYRRFSPGLRGAQLVSLIDFFREHQVHSLLDAGCGGGQLMRQIMQEFPGEFQVRGFDISANCLDADFDEIRDQILTVGCLWNLADYGVIHDGLICTDVMEHIPTVKVSQTLNHIFRSTGKAAYFGIALFPDGYGQKILGEPLHLTVKEPQWWLKALTEAGFQVARHLVEATPEGKPMWLHALLTVP